MKKGHICASALDEPSGLYLGTDSLTHNFGIDGSGNSTFSNNLTVSGEVTFDLFSDEVIHSNNAGLLSSSKIINADIDPFAAIDDTKLATIYTVGEVSAISNKS